MGSNVMGLDEMLDQPIDPNHLPQAPPGFTPPADLDDLYNEAVGDPQMTYGYQEQMYNGNSGLNGTFLAVTAPIKTIGG